MKSLEVLFTPADFGALQRRDLAETVCVVFDVLRATSTMVTALANGAAGIIPVETIGEALALRQKHPEILLAGERDGLRISASQTGSVAFDLGNSPREFTEAKVRERSIAMTTTNGTRALSSCLPARATLAACFLNLDATAAEVRAMRPAHLLLVASGTFEEAAYEDVLGAGALCARIWPDCRDGQIADSALMAAELYRHAEADLTRAFAQAKNGRRLLSRPELSEDVAFCLRQNAFPLVARLHRDGTVRKESPAG